MGSQKILSVKHELLSYEFLQKTGLLEPLWLTIDL